MRGLSLLAFLAALLAFVAVATAQPYLAQCVFTPTGDYGKALNVRGQLTFSAPSLIEPVTVTAKITGELGNAEYAISINEYGDLTDLKTGGSAGERFQGVGNNSFGCPPDPFRPTGNLGNWKAENGNIEGSQPIDIIELVGLTNSIVGLSVVLHATPDNCTGPLAAPSNKLAVCVIGVTNSDNNPALNANQAYNSAVAVLQPTSNCDAACSGTVWFTQTPGTAGVQVVASVAGLKSGTKHGFHIHQYGDLSAADGTSTGAHWNPNGRNHALPGTMPRHVGDLGNIQTYDQAGLGWYNYTDTNIPNVYSLLGRAVVIHADVDHGAGEGCDQAGSAGKRLMVGVIGRANLMTVPATAIPVNNDYENLSCAVPTATPKPTSEEDNSGLKAGLAIGWVLVGLLALVVIPGMVAYYWIKIRPSVAGDVYRGL